MVKCKQGYIKEKGKCIKKSSSLKSFRPQEYRTISYGGPGFLSFLTLIFIVLKLIGKIDWSWWWVLSPMWIPIAVVLGLALIIYLIIKLFY